MTSEKKVHTFKQPYIIALLELVLCPLLILIGVERDNPMLDYLLIGLVLVLVFPAVIFLGIYLLKSIGDDKENKEKEIKEGEIK
jgi:amino acid transporter